jgi:DNA-binding NarL/FixJ family response regulator
MPIITEAFKEQVETELAKMQEGKRNKNIDPLSIITMISKGKTDLAIAVELDVNLRTLEAKVSELVKIFRCANRTELACTAIRLKLIE